MYYFLIFAGCYQFRAGRGVQFVLSQDTTLTKTLEIEKSSLIINIKLILQYKELNSDPIRRWRT
jgi:hypothetical protein